jgi:hypothetical protein
MIDQAKAWQEFAALPPEAQQQVIDFMAFLRTRHKGLGADKEQGIDWGKEPFIGMWRDREDMEDSISWAT